MPLFAFTTKRHCPTLSFAVLFALIAGLASAAFSILLGDMFNSFTLYGGEHISDKDLIREISKTCGWVAGLGIATWGFMGLYFTTFVVFGESQMATARCRLFEGLLGKEQEWFETQKDGHKAFLSNIQANLHELQMATSQPLGMVIHYSFRTIASLGLAFYTSWNLSLVTLAGIPIFSAIISLLGSRMKPSVESQKAHLSTASKIVNSATTAIDTVKCFNGQGVELDNFVTKIQDAASQYIKHACLNSLQISVVRVMMFGMFVQGFWYGSALVKSGDCSAGEVLRTFWACLTAAQSIELIMPQVILLHNGALASSTLVGIVNAQVENRITPEMRGNSYPHYCEGEIEVSDLSFAYSSQPDKVHLGSVNLFFPAGETTFVIGKSGSGKSTLGQLLARFYLPTSGKIFIDKNPIHMLNVNWIRNNITLVEQRSVLFNESILANIAFGRRGHNQTLSHDVQECIDMAMLQTTIDGLPNGIHTSVGQGGNFLSGGQKQRVAIARARLRDTPILILDEPTSALDGTNRAEVMKAIRKWRKGKTTIIITHDMSQILDQDFVYILEQGTVVQAGYRNELEHVPENEQFFSSHGKVSSPIDTQDDFFDLSYYLDKSENPNDDDSSTYSLQSHQNEQSWLSLDYSNEAEPRNNRKHSCVKQVETSSPTWSAHFPYSGQGIGDTRVSGNHQVEIPMETIHVLHKKGVKSKSGLALTDYQPSTPHTLHNARVIRRRRLGRFKKRPRISRERYATSLRQIMSTIIPNLTGAQRLQLLLGCFCTLAHASATPVFSYCLAQLQQTFYNERLSASKWALVVLGVALCDGLVSYFMHYCLEVCGQTWVDCLRKQAFERVLDQPRQWFEKDENSPSQITSCLGQDAEEMRNLVSRFGGFILLAVAISVMAILWSLAVCWKLTLVALACGPVLYTITRGFESTTGLWERRCNEAGAIASEIFIETFAEIRTVRTLTLEPLFHKKYLQAASKCTEAGLIKALYTGFLFGLVESIVMFISALIFYYGTVLVSSLEFSVGDILTVFSLLLFSIGYASTVLSWIPQISTSRDMGSRMLRLAKLPEKSSHEYLGTMGVAKVAPVEITALDFRYPSRPNVSVLKDVSISISEGSCTAIVGRSGSGKSTIASLLVGLYETPPPQNRNAAISLGGVDIRQLHIPTLRSRVAIVSQQPTIFPGTIHANISYGLDEQSPLYTLQNVRAAAKAAGIDDFISSLSQGYWTVIGDGAVGLSGGQAQRLVIARALARRPQVLILDEATSSLDPTSADLIRQTVRDLVAAGVGLTVIVITHARAMMEIADHIVVLEQGFVVETGSYKELYKRAGGKLQALLEDEEANKAAD
ncbi:hypothetical protein FE257_012305 [Aspergillus nanangensis]|uniref:ABC a-pheromone efflux pump AtrD n=1 Tax=Aspergillus nanangensis TaxID=2582783 RepID=A0AAD4CGI6_ASPNN|nr:hypothetical protein FE257_012305 [Aspergillus nanangensis]